MERVSTGSVRPTLAALLICLSGLLLMPKIQLATDRLDWSLYAAAYNYIFADGFQTGNTSRWTVTVANATFTVRFPAGSSLAEEIADTVASDGSCFVPSAFLPDEPYGSVLVEGCRFERRADRILLHFRSPAP